MIPERRQSQIIPGEGVAIESYIDGEGPPLVVLPSYGRDGGVDYDDITFRLVAEGWKVIRPQPRGIGASAGSMDGLTLHDLAADVALVIRALAEVPAVVLGQAFGNVLARVVTTDHPSLVKAVVLAAAEASNVAEDVGKTPFIAGDLTATDSERIAALRKGFFAPDHDPSAWLSGWYPATLKMEHEAAKKTGVKESWACGDVPLLQIFGDHDPFIPKPYWHEMHDQFGNRVTVSVVQDASHALFPEQPDAVAEAILPWVARYKTSEPAIH